MHYTLFWCTVSVTYTWNHFAGLIYWLSLYKLKGGNHLFLLFSQDSKCVIVLIQAIFIGGKKSVQSDDFLKRELSALEEHLDRCVKTRLDLEKQLLRFSAGGQ